MKFEPVLELMESKAKKHDVSADRCGKIRNAAQSFEMNVVVVGAFSAGKSAMLNTFLGRSVLGEAQTPETAIASELVYGVDEHVEAFANGQAERKTPEEAKELDASRYGYLRWHLHSEALAGISGYTIVDMPGFNSNITNHNDALLRYVKKASAYILVIEVQDGGIKQSMADFLHEIRHYHNNLAIVITKCDLEIPEKIAEVEQNVRTTAKMLFGEDIPVITTSNQDADAEEKLTALIRGFDRENIVDQRFIPEVIAEGETLISILESKKKAIHSGDSVLLEEKKQLEKAKAENEKALRQKLNENNEKHSYQQAETLMGQVESALMGSVTPLAAAARSGNEAFSARVNSILRPVLVNALDEYTDESFSSLIGINDFQGQASSPLAAISDSQASNMYHLIVGTLGLATDVVAPWLEVVIMVLPDIIRLISGASQQDPQKAAEEKIRQEIIPRIISELYPNVTQSLDQITNQLAESLHKEFDEKINDGISRIDAIDRQLKESSDKLKADIAELDQDIAEIRSAIDSI